MAEDYDTHCRGYGEKEIAARVQVIKEQKKWNGDGAERRITGMRLG